MKKLTLTLIILISISHLLHAQWTTSGTVTSTTNAVGIGTTTPTALFNLSVNGVSPDGGNSIGINSNGLVIQGKTGGRLTNSGAQLEFVIPANTDGTNFWGQARIITVAGNTGTSDATGQMILGTRRMFNKLGTGAQWYYGNDLVIDGAGNVGIGTTTPHEALSVNGNIRAKQVKIEIVNWPDYVFKKDYQLSSLQEIKTYIDQNQHLPDMPSEAEVAKNGLNLGEMNKLLVKKVEELTLYLIEKDKEIAQQKKLNDKQAKENELQKSINEANEARLKTIENTLSLKN